MSLNASALRVLIDKGLTAEDILELAEAMENRSDRTAAERQQRRRDKVKAERDASHRDVTRDGSPNEYISNPPPESPVISDEMTAPSVDELKPEHVLEAWNTTAERCGLKAVRKFTPQRRRKLQVRIRQNTIDEFTEAIDAVARSPFLRGENDRGWRADFDWMLEPRNFTKLIEGNYDR